MEKLSKIIETERNDYYKEGHEIVIYWLIDYFKEPEEDFERAWWMISRRS